MSIIADALNWLGATIRPQYEITKAADGDGVFVAKQDGWTVIRQRGKQRQTRHHIFDDITSFAEWLNRHVEEDTAADILVDTDRIIAGVFAGKAEEDKVECRLSVHPRALR